MIVSGEQTRLAAHYVEPPVRRPAGIHAEVSPEFMRQVIAAVQAAPEIRTDRVREAMERQRLAPPDAGEIADLIIARAICDGLR